jgi:hypothetical protein
MRELLEQMTNVDLIVVQKINVCTRGSNTEPLAWQASTPSTTPNWSSSNDEFNVNIKS